MPCTYYLPGEEAAIRADEYHKRVELLTQLLCTACRGLESSGSNMLKPGGPLGDWWIEHKNRDKKAAEAERRQKEHELKHKRDELSRLQKRVKKLEKELK